MKFEILLKFIYFFVIIYHFKFHPHFQNIYAAIAPNTTKITNSNGGHINVSPLINNLTVISGTVSVPIFNDKLKVYNLASCFAIIFCSELNSAQYSVVD